MLGDGIGRQQRQHAGAALVRAGRLTFLLGLTLAVGARGAAVAWLLLGQCRCRGGRNQHERDQRTAQL